MGAEKIFEQAAVTALKLIGKALDGDRDALKRLNPIMPKRLRTTMARQAAESRARKKLRTRR